MDILCTTSLDNNEQVKNLCECIEILGGRPCVSGCTVCVEYHGEKDTAEKFIKLFEQYARHGICSIS